ncbi:MAG TPA: Uma2 family endonuclease [Caldilineaceae bacterium]|nr:Uma2 family endonuclease [Caldilineaceae bacterium]
MTQTHEPAERVQPRRWTRQEFEQLASLGFFEPEERLELLDGEIFRMTLQSSWHATSVTKAAKLANLVYRQGYVVRVQMPLAIGDASLPEPDVAIMRGAIDDYRDAHPKSAVLVIEVADSSLLHDRERKRQSYARAGIPEYWLINLSDHCLEVFRNPENGDYQFHLILSPAESITPLTHPRRTIAVRDLLP